MAKGQKLKAKGQWPMAKSQKPYFKNYILNRYSLKSFLLSCKYIQNPVISN